jgi:hypothetical protein
MSTFTIVSTTHTTKEVPIVWKGPNWESFLNALFNAKVIPKVVICLCDRESFRFLFMIAMKSTYIMKICFKFGQYMVGTGEVLILLPSFMKELVFYYVCFLKGSGNRCRLILWGARNSHHSLKHCVNFCGGSLAL